MNNKPHILIVDDEPGNLELLTTIVCYSYETTTASDGTSAIEQAHLIQPDMILLDVNMPDIDGYEVCRQIKSNDKLHDIPVIFLSAMDSSDNKIKGFEAGGVDYITRPFNSLEILARIQTHIELRNIQKQYQKQNILMQEEITRRQQAEIEVRQSEEKYRTLFEKTNDAVFIIGLDFKIKEINHQAADLLGTSQDAILNQDMTAFNVSEDGVEDGAKRAERLINGEVVPVFERKLRRADGREFFAEINVTLIHDKNGEPIYFHNVVRDISERRHLQFALQESEKRYRGILENTSEAVFSTDRYGTFTYVNPVMVKRSGYTEAGLIGKHFTELIDKDWREKASAFFQNQFLERIPETIFSFPLTPLNGKHRIWLEQTTGLVIEDNKIKGFLGITRDITDRKNVEEQREQLIAELDAFAHTVAHDLKTPLSTIKLSSSSLRTMYNRMSEEKRLERVEKINISVDKMVNIIDEILLLATIRLSEDIPRQQLDMTQIIKDTLRRLKTQIEEHDAELIIPDSFPVAIGYAPWIEEVWANYLSNAIKYGGNPPHIEIGSTHNDDHISFWIKDNGAGISSDKQEELLFKPVQRLNQLDIEGHGFGLSIVQRIIHKLGGTVGVESEPGKGSTFYFTLPTNSNNEE